MDYSYFEMLKICCYHLQVGISNLVILPESSKEGDGEDDGRGAAELGAEDAPSPPNSAPIPCTYAFGHNLII